MRLMPEFVAGYHRFYQIVALCEQLEYNCTNVDSDQNQENALVQVMDARQPVTCFLADQRVQWPLGQNVVIGKQTGADLDASKASRLQKEISELQAQFDQKRIDHMIETRKLNPNTGRGYMQGGPMIGSYGSGYCWQ